MTRLYVWLCALDSPLLVLEMPVHLKCSTKLNVKGQKICTAHVIVHLGLGQTNARTNERMHLGKKQCSSISHALSSADRFPRLALLATL